MRKSRRPRRRKATSRPAPPEGASQAEEKNRGQRRKKPPDCPFPLLKISRYLPQRSVRTMAFGSSAEKTLLPATRMVAPASTQSLAVSAFTPPSTSMSQARPRASMLRRRARIFSGVSGMNFCPP